MLTNVTVIQPTYWIEEYHVPIWCGLGIATLTDEILSEKYSSPTCSFPVSWWARSPNVSPSAIFWHASFIFRGPSTRNVIINHDMVANGFAQKHCGRKVAVSTRFLVNFGFWSKIGGVKKIRGVKKIGCKKNPPPVVSIFHSATVCRTRSGMSTPLYQEFGARK